MNATIKQAENNERNLSITKTGYGHWRVSCTYRGKTISTTTTNSIAVDDFKSNYGEKNEDNQNRIKLGYIQLCQEIIDDNFPSMY